MIPRLEHVGEMENLHITEDGMKSLVTLAYGDMRKALNILQSTSMSHEIVTEDTVYTCIGHPKRGDIEDMLQWMLNGSFTSSYNNIVVLKSEKGLALQDIITDLHTYVHRIDFPTAVKIFLLDKMAEIENRLAAGASEKLQTSALLSAFQLAKNMVPKSDMGS